MRSEPIEDTPANRMAATQATLALAVRLSGAVRSGRIDESIYRYPIKLETGGTGLHLPAFNHGTMADLLAGIDNIVMQSVSASALTTEEVLHQVFGDFNDKTEPNMLGLRVMVHQLRNAFAHRPWRPTWVVRKSFRNLYPILLSDGNRFTFDATRLSGEGVMPDQFGGLEFWIQVLAHCRRLVDAH